VTYANRGAFDAETAYAAAHNDLAAKLYVVVGDQEGLFAPVQEIFRRSNPDATRA
jgi:hypothetical protein